MKKLYDEYIYIPKDGKIREKAMTFRVVTTVVVILMCLAFMSFTAYAYFSYNITSASNLISAANFEIDVTFASDNPAAQPVEVEKSAENSYLALLEGGVEYKITISPTADSTANTGFCVISSESSKNSYHTQQFILNREPSTKVVSFNLTVTNTAMVEIYANWGTSSYYADYVANGDTNELYIISGETVIMPTDALENPAGTTQNEAENTPEKHNAESNASGAADVTSTNSSAPKDETPKTDVSDANSATSLESKEDTELTNSATNQSTEINKENADLSENNDLDVSSNSSLNKGTEATDTTSTTTVSKAESTSDEKSKQTQDVTASTSKREDE